MKSMTGFGLSRFRYTDHEYEVMVRAVNGRFFEIRSHIPKEFLSMESSIKDLIAAQLKRGTCDFYLHRKTHQFSLKRLQQKNLQFWLQAGKEIQKKSELNFNFELSQFLMLPGIFQSDDVAEVSGAEKKLILLHVKKALKACLAQKQREGSVLRKDIDSQIRKLMSSSKKMFSLREKVRVELKDRLEQKMKLWESESADANKRSVDLMSLIDKADINEELVRFEEHLKNCHGLLKKDLGSGKTLDFYCQELLREVNTIGSKSQLAILTHEVVGAKMLIERLREQVQNIE